MLVAYDKSENSQLLSKFTAFKCSGSYSDYHHLSCNHRNYAGLGFWSYLLGKRNQSNFVGTIIPVSLFCRLSKLSCDDTNYNTWVSIVISR